MIPTMDVAALLMMSPTKSGKVRVSSTRYRNDPYRTRVNPFMKPGSPVFAPKLRVKAAADIDTFSAASSDSSILSLAAAAVVLPPAKIEVAAAAPVAAAPKAYAAVAGAPRAADQVPLKPLAAAAPSLVSSASSSVASASKPGMAHYALVGFKHEAAMYRAPFRVAAGDIVIVEADRGEHIGVVQSVTTTAPKFNVPSHILRHANVKEAASIDDLTVKERKIAANVQKLAESLGLGIRVVDVEFQMDENKLTVFFQSKVFVDFRKLQRSLFREFRCRIWLVNWAEVRTYTPVPVNMPC